VKNSPRILAVLAGVALLAVIILSTCTYAVDEREAAIFSFMGQVSGVEMTPGLKFKNPFATVMSVRTYLQEYDTEPSNTVTRDKKNILISFYVKYRVNDPLIYTQTVGTRGEAEKRIDDVVYSALKTNVSQSDFEVIVANRKEIEEATLAHSLARVKQYGIELVDFQIKRTDMPPQILESVYKRMKEERLQKAQTDRSEGIKLKQIATAEADKKEVEVRSTAYEQKQKLMGEGDKEALRIVAEAYGQDVDFAMYVKTLDLYREALKAGDTRMIFSTKNELFQFLGQSATEKK